MTPNVKVDIIIFKLVIKRYDRIWEMYRVYHVTFQDELIMIRWDLLKNKNIHKYMIEDSAINVLWIIIDNHNMLWK